MSQQPKPPPSPQKSISTTVVKKNDQKTDQPLDLGFGEITSMFNSVKKGVKTGVKTAVKAGNLTLIIKDLSKVKTGFESVPLQIYFEIAGLASAEKWRKIQNIDGKEYF